MAMTPERPERPLDPAHPAGTAPPTARSTMTSTAPSVAPATPASAARPGAVGERPLDAARTGVGDGLAHTGPDATPRRAVEQPATAAAPPITTTAEPIRPTPDDAIHGTPPDLSHHQTTGHGAALQWGALAAIGLVAILFLVGLGTLVFGS